MSGGAAGGGSGDAAGGRPATLDVNVDMGESFGRWRLGDDAAIMPFVSSASIACGFHAGDPRNMRETAGHAVAHGVTIGAHVGLPDLIGFGRRKMAVSAEEVRDDTLYQLGALQAVARAAGGRVAYVKPHGALYVLCAADPALAGGVAEAIAAVDPTLPLLLLADADRDVSAAVSAHGVRLVREAFADLEYEPGGALVIERVKQAWDPARVAERAVRVAREGTIDARDGSSLQVDAATVCIHGDGPNAVEIARAVRARLDAEGIAVAPFAG
ncbi:LamB/YcsF family protein [Conexibacter woesei]|uniref:5-oxoprolinase subunit A n=1 Tax=Conexibacter woesei (strain DSM 14684 / CCUG 47730 / CIP 108061 / JCM 11494 / NBRC 100937 / ID131577) TaxID=469383 RepID=D3F024_CONWI|nr:5-oxoprolinase subunit PxpA [Conexibacter woesei]ADB50000.1 LamB/YcsF family protein [Conexibacter woesei DSM 14684]